MQNYQHAITVQAPPNEAFAALTTGIADWWSTDIEGAAAQVGDAFTIRFGSTSKTFKIVALTPDQSVRWECTQAYIDYAPLQNKSEWVGHFINWTLTPNGAGTTIQLLQEGLTPEVECYDMCLQGWAQFLKSLQQLLDTKVGAPFSPAVV